MLKPINEFSGGDVKIWSCFSSVELNLTGRVRDGEAVRIPFLSQEEKMPKHTFQINAPEAKKVCVAGDFNGWKTEDIRLK